jgi:hypothetical protein
MPDQVKVERLPAPVGLAVVTQIVIVVVVGVTVFVVPCPVVEFDVLICASVPVPVTVTVTDAVVSNWNPVGAVRIILPTDIPLLSDSVITGPVKTVDVPPVESAEMALPPVATVTVPVALAVVAPKSAMTNRVPNRRLVTADK